ncbi:DegT/DnrJ/EryC1/StrS family aminotransferase [Candidatus Collierbacteria bacterium]|nr:DegT/DnrJ/EryC1/StrS family aminotransferase [Candidatus Collierbacteria bacterium]
MIPVLAPTSSSRVEELTLEVLRSGWWGYGPKSKQLEVDFAKYVGTKYAIGTNSGTAALDLCLKVYGIRGGELITTPMTFVADAIVGEWNGMDVTFADIEENSLNLDPKAVIVTPQTKAIIAVDSHGRLANFKELRKKFKGLIIEDAAHAMYTPGAGEGGDITIWSFQAVKSLPAGDGGMITTNDEAIFKKLRTLTWLGVEKHTYDRVGKVSYSWDYDITQSQGTKSYMNDLTAAIVLGQLERLDEMTAKRRAIQSVYNEAFREMKQIKLPMYSHTCQYYTMQCERRDELSNYLADNGIATSVHFKPLSEMTYWKKAIKRPLPVTERVWPKLLTLPVHDGLKWTEAELIIKRVKEFYGK